MTADNKQQTAADGRTLVIAAAGTGGHVMPGLAVARVMADRGWKIVWIGTTTGMEKGLVERQGIEFHPLNFQGMRGRGITGMITGGIKMLKAIWDARKLLKNFVRRQCFPRAATSLCRYALRRRISSVPLC